MAEPGGGPHLTGGGPALAAWYRYLGDLEGSQQPVDNRLSVTIGAAQAAISELTGKADVPANHQVTAPLAGSDVPLTAGMVIGALTGRADDLRQEAQRAYDHARGMRSRRARRALEEAGHALMRRSLELILLAERVQQTALESRDG